jgi:hypothetical protein
MGGPSKESTWLSKNRLPPHRIVTNVPTSAERLCPHEIGAARRLNCPCKRV